MERRKNMTRKILLALLCCSAGLSGCERLSEKDKMDMIAKCDTEARKKFEETGEPNAFTVTTREIVTHYSFKDQACYAHETSLQHKFAQNYTTDYMYHGQALYDGLTKKELVITYCKDDWANKINECEDGGDSFGTLVEPLQKDGEKVTYRKAVEIIEKRMNRP